MVKIKSRTWAEKDDPIFTGRFTFSSHRNISIFNERNQNEKISKSKLSNFQKNNPDSYKTQNDKGRDIFKSNKGLDNLTVLLSIIKGLIEDRPVKPLPLESLIKNVST